jgi:lipopolysaccharide biosynthesis protein
MCVHLKHALVFTIFAVVFHDFNFKSVATARNKSKARPTIKSHFQTWEDNTGASAWSADDVLLVMYIPNGNSPNALVSIDVRSPFD